jgi:hypothetical protein
MAAAAFVAKSLQPFDAALLIMSMAPGFSSEVAPEDSPVWRAGDQP